VLSMGLWAEIAQLVEHATENRGVHSSILCLGTRGRGSVVERLLAKEKVVGSNPIARSKRRMQVALAYRRQQQR
jgi:hypothetical protein